MVIVYVFQVLQISKAEPPYLKCISGPLSWTLKWIKTVLPGKWLLLLLVSQVRNDHSVNMKLHIITFYLEPCHFWHSWKVCILLLKWCLMHVTSMSWPSFVLLLARSRHRQCLQRGGSNCGSSPLGCHQPKALWAGHRTRDRRWAIMYLDVGSVGRFALSFITEPAC